MYDRYRRQLEDRTVKKTWATAGIILVLITVGIAMIWPQAKEIYLMKKEERELRNLETEVIRIELAGRRFDIPMRYMYGEAIEKYHQWPEAKKERVKVDAITLSVLLPDLRPYYPDDSARWKVKGHGDRVEMSIMKPVGKTDWFPWLRDQYWTGKAPGNVRKESAEYGLIHFHDLGDRYFPENESYELTINCDEPEPGMFPSCKVKSNYRAGIVLEYYYSLKYLSDWRKIDDGLKAMCDKFAEEAQSESLIREK